MNRRQRERKQARRQQHMESTRARGITGAIASPPPATRDYSSHVRSKFTFRQLIVRNDIVRQRMGRGVRG